ncbi:tetratricopeptide repeat protein 25 [Caerostris darwini]|uniref:Outer dynein arm-docking complex subunit 4 n=1 Tax=Caerostris darwini TaxID=1538125 RepID=A0AAV4RP28_9ARAC|nr:tetratricopeptide repeat protein 25 [Caerostris darwini]
MALDSYESEEDGVKAPKFSITMYESEGNKFLRSLLIEKAIESFDGGLKMDPNNIKCLLGRIKCLMKLCDYDEAQKSAEKVIAINPKCTEAVVLIGEILYSKGNFEESYMTYKSVHRQQPYFPFSYNVKYGHQKCIKAIQNALDTETRLVVTRTEVEEVDNLLQKNYKRKARTTGATPQVTFHKDVKLVESLVQDKDLDFASAAFRDLLMLLETSAEFDRLQKPDLSEKPWHESLELRRVKDKCKLSKKFLQEGDIESCKRNCFEILKMFDDLFGHYTLETLKVLARVMHFLGLASESDGDFSKAQKYYQHELKIGQSQNLTQVERKALLSAGECYLKWKDFEQAAATFHQCLDIAETKEEKANFLNKIANCEFNLNNLDDAKRYATQSLHAAKGTNNYRLQCSTAMLLAEAEVTQGNMKEAKKHYRRALAIVQQSGDPTLRGIINMNRVYDQLEEDDK